MKKSLFLLTPVFLFNYSCTDQGATKDKKMNVLFISVDDLRPALGCYGKDHIQTPNIDRLAEDGILFNRAYCQQSISAPSRISMLTGLRPDSTHIYRLDTKFRETMPYVTTLPQHFRQNGYYCVSLGKIFHHHNGNVNSWSEAEWSPKISFLDYKNKENRDILKKNGKPFAKATDKADMTDSAYLDGKILIKAIEKLNELQDTNFFIGVGFIRPHLPFIVPQKYWELYNREEIPLPENDNDPIGAPDYSLTRRWEIDHYYDIPSKQEQFKLSKEKVKELRHGYFASVSFIDSLIGKLITELKQLDLYENTIIVLWGDHGFKLGEHGEWCKFTNFEIDTRIPLIFRVPGKLTKGTKTNAIVEAVDIYPTLCNLIELPLPSHLQGESFIKVINNPEIEWNNIAFSQFWRDNGKFKKNHIMGLSMRTDSFRFTRWQFINNPDSILGYELYDLSQSFRCKENIAKKEEYKKKVINLDSIMTNQWARSLE